MISAIVAGVKQDWRLYLSIVLALLAGWAGAAAYGVGERYSFMVYPGFTLLLAAKLALVFFVIYGTRLVLIERPARPIQRWLSDLKQGLSTPEPYRGFILLLVLSILFSGVSSFKSLIPVIHPYSWDAALIRFDLWLHGGRAPWLWLQPLLGQAWITAALNFIYNLWFFVMFFVLLQQLFFGYAQLRRRYLFIQSFILCWCINGGLFALIFASVGPCFYGLLYPELTDPFAPLLSYLQQADRSWTVWALDTQQMLWDYYRQDALGFGSGISALPSMHVSVAWLLVLTYWQAGRLWRWLTLSFFGAILLGSVHLGWHYAVDGYFSVLSTSAIWWGVRKTAGLAGHG